MAQDHEYSCRESVVSGVGDLEEHRRFGTHFGLPLERADDSEAIFRLASGSRFILPKHSDSRLPSSDPIDGDGLKETVWGLNMAEDFQKYAARRATEAGIRAKTQSLIMDDYLSKQSVRFLYSQSLLQMKNREKMSPIDFDLSSGRRQYNE